MKILSITAQKPHSTGSGTYLTELVKSLDKAGCTQAVVAGIYETDEVSFPKNVDFYPVLFNKDINYPVVGMSDVMPYPSTKYRDLDDKMISEFEDAFIKVIEKAINEFAPDIIVCHHLFLLTALIRKHFPCEKIYGICHGTDLRQMINCKKLAKIVGPEVKKLDHIFALHDEQAKQISHIFDINPSKISVIGSGYNSELFNTNDRKSRNEGDPIKICYAGKMSSAKAVPELLDAIDELNEDSVYNIEYYLAGGCQEEAIKSRLEGLPSNVKYLGQISQEKLAKVYKSCDIFILPSYYEGLGLVLIEAMASGLLCISTDLPGIKDWINENVKNPEVFYIPMPKMASIDVPTDDGRKQFVKDIKLSIETAAQTISNFSENKNFPDTSKISWEVISNRLLELSR